MMMITTILTSSAVAAIVTHLFSHSKEHIIFMRQKIETLYLSFEEYDRVLCSHFVSYYSVMNNKISYDDLLDIQNANTKNVGKSLDLTKIISTAYFPDLSIYLDAYVTKLNAVNDIITEHKYAYKSVGPEAASKFYDTFHTAILDFSNSSDNVRNHILEESKKYKSDALPYIGKLASYVANKRKQIKRISLGG